VCKNQQDPDLENKPNKRITINHIFSDNHNWDIYTLKHRKELREIEVKEVQKMLKCGKKGFKVFHCPKCGSEKIIYYGCDSKITNRWADQTARKTFNVKHRHIVLTIQDEPKTTVLRPTTRLLKTLMDCAILTIAQAMEWTSGKEVTPRRDSSAPHPRQRHEVESTHTSTPW